MDARSSIGWGGRESAREGRDKGIPESIGAARAQASESFCELQSAREFLSPDQWAVRVVVDTNMLLDDPDLAQFTSQVGKRYLVYLPTIVLRELVEHFGSDVTTTCVRGPARRPTPERFA